MQRNSELLLERTVGESTVAMEPLMATNIMGSERDDTFVARLVRELYESGDLALQIMTVEEAANKFGVPFPTVNSWTRGNPETAKNFLPVLRGITKKERLILTSDFLKCLLNWTPRARNTIDPDQAVLVAESVVNEAKRSKRNAAGESSGSTAPV